MIGESQRRRRLVRALAATNVEFRHDLDVYASATSTVTS